MDWSNLAKQVIGLGAPLLGAALGGPFGGAAGQILAGALGAAAPTPEAVQAALPAAAPERLDEAEARWAEALRAQAEAAGIVATETQRTMRAELAAEDLVQRWWRPLYAIELTLECAALWAAVLQKFYVGDAALLASLFDATALLVAYWGFRFGVLGVYMSGRTREKVCAATGQDAASGLGTLARSVAANLAGRKAVLK
jgi:hypothetical protein